MADFITDAQRTSLIELYVGYFNRAPEADGLSYWSNQFLAKINSGMSESAALTAIADSFYDAGVQFGVYSTSMTVDSFITLGYKNALGRDLATESEADRTTAINYWSQQLNSGAVSKGEFIQRLISDAKGFAGDPTWGWVATYLTNRVAVGSWYANNSTGVTGSEAITVGTQALTVVTQATVQAGQTAAEAVTAAQATCAGSYHLTVDKDIATATTFEAQLYTAPQTGNQIQTLTSVDSLTGSTGSTLNAVLNNTEPAGTKPTMKGVETVNLTVVTAGSILDAANSTGIKTVNNVNSAQDLDVQNLANLVDVGITNTVNTVDTTIRFANSVVSAADNAVNLTLNSVGQGATAGYANAVNLRGQTAGGIETLNITATGGASRLTSLGSDASVVGANITNQSVLKTVKVTGAANLRIDNKLFGVTSFNSSESTGAMRVGFADGADNQAVSVIGGSGDDRFDFGAGLTVADTVDGGTGTNTLVVAGGANTFGSTNLTGVTNFQKLELNNGAAGLATGSYDLSKLSALTLSSLTVKNAALIGNTVTITNAKQGMDLNINGLDTATAAGNPNEAPNVTMTLATGLDTAADSLNVHLGRQSSTATVALTTGDLTVNEFETVNLESAGTTATVMGTTNGVTDAALAFLNITGSKDLTITGVVGGGAGNVTLVKVDASTASGDLNFTTQTGAGGGTGATAYTGVNILSGTGNDAIVGGANSDRVALNSGNDTYQSSNTAGKQGDVITMGDGIDTLTLLESSDGGATASGTGTGTAADTELGHRVTDFTAGAGGDVITMRSATFGGGNLTGTVAIDTGDGVVATAAADGDVLILTGQSFANYTAAEAYVQGVNAAFRGVIVFRDSGFGEVRAVADATTAVAAGDAIFALENLTTVSDIAKLTASNFNFI